MRAILILLLLCISSIAQTRDELIKKYGAPTVQESYRVRPNVSIMVTYGKAGSVCNIRIVPDFGGSGASSETLMAIADELVPQASRGKNIINGFLSGVSYWGTTYDYDKVSIWNVTKDTTVRPFIPDRWVSIGWKDKSCETGPDSRRPVEVSS